MDVGFKRIHEMSKPKWMSYSQFFLSIFGAAGAPLFGVMLGSLHFLLHDSENEDFLERGSIIMSLYFSLVILIAVISGV